MKKLILTILLLLVVWSAQASENFLRVEKQETYTYEQGLAISVDIADCLNADMGIVRIFLKMIAQFKKETGYDSTAVMILVMRISQEYRIGMLKKYLTKKDGKYIKFVVEDCKQIVESKHLKK